MSLRVLARNALSLIGANVVTNAVGFAVTVLLVRHLGVEGIGRYTYATTYAALFGILSSFGLYLVLTRQVAAEPGAAGARLGSVLLLQAFLVPLALGVTVGSALVLHPASDALPIGLAGVGVGLASLAGTYGAVVTGREKIHLNAAVNLGMALLWGLLALALVGLGLGVTGLIVFFVVHKLANVLALRAVTRRACGISPRFGVRELPTRDLLRAAAPFALLIVLNDLYWNAGMILVGRLRGAEEVGIFAVAYRVIAVLVAVVGTVSGVLYPRLAHLFTADAAGFVLLMGRTRKYALAIGLPLGLAVSLLADRIIVVLFGPAFADAGGSLRLLGWFIPLLCVYSPLSYAMLAMAEERTWLILHSVATGVVIGGSLLLVPALGHLGAAGALLASGVFLAAAVPWAITARGIPVALTPADLKVVGACGAMGVTLWWLRGVPVLALVASVTAYAAILHLAGFVTADERLSVRTSFAIRGER
ncbi:MAG: flippase [Candidatus Rokubacteria bacterium]|nr:flippase [Candidatus Rokubacteria bacterium]